MYLTHKNLNDYYVLDIECDSLTPSVIWVVVTKNCGTGEVKEFYDAESFKAWLRKDFKLVGHNLLSFDVPVLNRLWGTEIDSRVCVDTLVLSSLYNPALLGGHSLESWGERLKYPKGASPDFSRLSPEMVQYCVTDVALTDKVFKALTEKMRRLGYSELSCEIEHKIRVIINEQERTGCYFDLVGAKSLRDNLLREQSDLTEQIQNLFPRRLEQVAEYRLRYRKDGSVVAQHEKHRNVYPRVVDYPDEGRYECWDYVTFNLGSPKQRIERLLGLGWEPTEFTKKGNPKVDETALVKFSEESGRPEVKALAEWLVLQGRITMLAGNPETGSKGWIGNVKDHGGGDPERGIPSDTRIHGKVFSCGAANRRMRHSEPNCANIPTEAKARYGHECRALWGIQPGKGLIQVGTDASGLENVGLLHYLNNDEATKLLNQPKPNDIHTMNARLMTELLGREIDREWGAKTCVPLDTRILTRRGWKCYNELVIGEDVLGYNQDTKMKEWTKLLDINVCEDEVVEISNSRRVFRATRNHRWFVRQRRRGLNSWSRVNGQYLEDQVRTTDELTTESSIIINAPFNAEQDKVSSVTGLVGKYDIDWERRVLEMSHSERVQFVQGFLLADGHVNTLGHWVWTQNKGNISEGLLLASYLVHSGQLHVNERTNPNHKMWTVNLAVKSHVTGQNLEKKSLGVQAVWCPRTDLGSWVMRQGDEITITGNSWYANLYGSYPKKLGWIVKGTEKDGEKIQEVFFNNCPGLKRLTKEVQYEWKTNNGRLETIDGGYVLCPSAHAALNYKISSLGACVMKLGCIILQDRAREDNLRFRLLLTVHDEWQKETKEEDGDKLGRLAVASIEEAARELKFRVPLTGQYKLGYSWADCH